jgi:hypothetical protein
MNMRKYIQSFIAGITAFTCLSVHADGPQITGIPQNTVLTTKTIEAMCKKTILKHMGESGKFYTNKKYPNILSCSVDGNQYPFFVLRKNMTYLQWVQAKIGNVKGLNPNELGDIFINLFDNTCLNERFSTNPVGKSCLEESFYNLPRDDKLTNSGKKNLLDNPLVNLIPPKELKNYINKSLEKCMSSNRDYIDKSLASCNVNLNHDTYLRDKKAIDAIKATPFSDE